MRRRAFTLVELLVVIGIIALLMSILFPVIGRVRKQGEATKCASNLRGMAQAWHMYASQYKISPPGRLDKSRGDDSVYGLVDGTEEYRPRWYELLGGMVGKVANRKPTKFEDDTWTIDDQWFLCPTVPEWNNSRNYPYGYNFQFLGNTRPKGNRTNFTSRVWVNYPVQASRVRAASETVMAADSMGTAIVKAPRLRQGYYADGTKDQDAVCNKGFLLDPPRLTADSDRADLELDKSTYRSGPDARPMNKVNVAFCDGHVATMSVQEMGYVVAPDGSIPVYGTGATNRLFSGTAQDDPPPSVN
jgi:prepilin-type N-terminal cleavage/methylation domain-containing protein/prepilin-type processing-associated H-X9-DG protein